MFGMLVQLLKVDNITNFYGIEPGTGMTDH